MDIDDHLSRLIPHRLDALAIAVLMLKFRMKWEEPKPMQIFVEGQLQFEGLTNLFTNPIFETGVLHIRALLEFLGLKANFGKLVQLDISTRRRDDSGIEKIAGPTGFLPLVTPEQVRSSYPADPALAETSLVAVIAAANKGLAHFSTKYPANPTDVKHVLLAAQLTQQLFEERVYAPLGRQRPPLPIKARSR